MTLYTFALRKRLFTSICLSSRTSKSIDLVVHALLCPRPSTRCHDCHKSRWVIILGSQLSSKVPCGRTLVTFLICVRICTTIKFCVSSYFPRAFFVFSSYFPRQPETSKDYFFDKKSTTFFTLEFHAALKGE
jgi:hypothetical protein